MVLSILCLLLVGVPVASYASQLIDLIMLNEQCMLLADKSSKTDASLSLTGKSSSALETLLDKFEHNKELLRTHFTGRLPTDDERLIFFIKHYGITKLNTKTNRITPVESDDLRMIRWWDDGSKPLLVRFKATIGNMAISGDEATQHTFSENKEEQATALIATVVGLRKHKAFIADVKDQPFTTPDELRVWLLNKQEESGSGIPKVYVIDGDTKEKRLLSANDCDRDGDSFARFSKIGQQEIIDLNNAIAELWKYINPTASST